MSKTRQIEISYAIIDRNFSLIKSPCIEIDENNVLVGIGKGCKPGVEKIGNSILMPALCNAHVHLLDATLIELGEDRNLEELVSLPSGLKYRYLESIDLKIATSIVRDYLRKIYQKGVTYLASYFEGGRSTVNILENIVKTSPEIDMRSLLQPLTKNPESYTHALLHSFSDGIGMDTILDLEANELKKLVELAHALGKQVHVHLSETIQLLRRSDYEIALEVKPTVAVHLTWLPREKILELGKENIGVVFCPRSNIYHLSKIPELSVLIELYNEDLKYGLGTDNVAWIPPWIDEEAQFAYVIYREKLEGRLREHYAKSILSGISYSCIDIITERLRKSRLVLHLRRLHGIEYTNNVYITLVKRLSESIVEEKMLYVDNR